MLSGIGGAEGTLDDAHAGLSLGMLSGPRINRLADMGGVVYKDRFFSTPTPPSFFLPRDLFLS